MTHEHYFKVFETAAESMVSHISSLLQRKVVEAGRAVLAVGGGRTPKRVLPMLANQDCPWRYVTVTLTDDRQVSMEDPDSNEGLVRNYLLRERAREAAFNGLIGTPGYQDLQLDVAYLGFGEDGHVASLFPRGPELAATHQGTIDTFARVQLRERISLTLPTICAAQHLIFLISSVEKYRIYQRACKAPEAQKLPLAEVLRKTRASVSVFIFEG